MSKEYIILKRKYIRGPVILHGVCANLMGKCDVIIASINSDLQVIIV